MSGRFVNVCGQMGVRQMALTVGKTMGPPAEREYAVEPVGVEMMRPSALYSQMKLSPAQASRSTMRAMADLAMTTSIECSIFRDDCAFPLERNAQHLAARHPVIAGQGAFELGEEILRRDGSQEAETAQIDGEQRDGAIADGSCRGEQGSVSAEDDCEIAALGNVSTREARPMGVARGLEIEAHADAARFEPGEKVRDEFSGLGGVRFGKYANSPNGGHRVRTPYCLPRR